MRSRKCVRDVVLSCVLMVGSTVLARAEDQAAESAPTSPPSQSTTPATDATETTAAVNPATEETEEAEQARRESVEFERHAKEYRKTEKDGQTLYCRKEKALGTRLAKQVCLTDSQLRARIRNAEEVRTGMSDSRGACKPPAC